MEVITIPCLQDNFAYLIICTQTNDAAVVDPAEATPVLNTIRKTGTNPVGILNTHHHWDHVGGNEELLKKFPRLRVYGHASDKGRIPGQNVSLEEGDLVEIGNLQGHITHNPGHTSGAITYYFENTAFTGDTLFAAGCGRLFEGTPQQMYQSLNEKIGGNPLSTNIYFGHEYTGKNLRFAQSVEPGNPYIHQKLNDVREIRRTGKFTTPSTLEAEYQTNPFMRCDSPEIQATVQKHDPKNDLSPVSVFRVLRQLKDRF